MSTFLLRIWRRIIFVARRDRLDRELAAELEFHRSLKERENIRAGLLPEDAADASRKQMGNVTLAREESREIGGFTGLERFWQDVRYALRTFRKSPTFTAVAAVSLALGIGGNAAMFSLVNALLIQPLPYREPDRLLRITGFYPKGGLAAFQQLSRSMDVASFSPDSEFNLTGQGEAIRLVGSLTSANLLDVLGAHLERGRAFQLGEDRVGRDRIVILSHALWKNKFEGDPQIIGRSITLNGVSRQVVGVMPPGFAFPSARVHLWAPTVLDPTNRDDYWGSEFVPLIGRLRPGANLPNARSEIRPTVAAIWKMFPYPMRRDWNSDADAIPLQDDVVSDIRGKLLVLLSSVGIVLLIACTNVASLLLSRSTVRRKEIALRVALGASRSRIVRQLLTESVLLAVFGGGLGILVGMLGLSVFKSVLPLDTPGLASIGIDWRVAAFVTVLSVLTGLAFGIAPALSASQVDLAGAIKTGGQRSATTYWIRLRSWLIAGEVALTVVLLVGAGLLVKSLYRLSQVDPGFRPAHILTIRISPNQSVCNQRAACIAAYGELLQRAHGVSGVSDVAVANTVPMDGQLPLIAVDVEGHPKTADYPAPMLWAGAISPDYFSMMQIPLLAGRGLKDSDGANSPPVLVISISTARHFWPGENPIGKHIKPAWDKQWRTVVGIVGDVRQYNLADSGPNWVAGGIYMPYAQSVQGDQQLPAVMNLLVKTSADPLRAGGELRRLAIDQNPNVPVSSVQTMESIVSTSVSSMRSTVWVFISFAAAAIILAAVGIYGLVSYCTAQRTYEIGVRIAMGARKGSIVGLVVAQGLRLALLGIGTGVVVAFALTRLMSSLLYGVTATDPITFLAVIVSLLGVTLAASYIPAHRAARIDPIKSMRVD